MTGASGFLGSHLVDHCARAGHHVRALVRPQSDTTRLHGTPSVEPAYGDLGDAESMRQAVEGVDVVLHSAARVVDHGTRAQFWDTNVDGTRRLLDAAGMAGVRRFVFVSSPSAVMRPDEGDRYDIDESVPYPDRWLNLYSETKAVAEQLVRAANRPGFTTCALRPRGIWGPRDHSGFLPKLLAKMLDGRLPDLSGGKRVLVSLCHCDNAVAACLRAADAPAERIGGNAYFIADAERTDLWAFLARVAELFGGRPPTRRVPAPVLHTAVRATELLWRLPPLAARHEPPLSRYSMALLTRSGTYDTGAAARDLGYAPVVSQETGLGQLADWVESVGGVRAFVRSATLHT
ncbi:NAD-dependent epimerase/dehydratase family protein [Streptomyces sp. AK02-04a]|uniref:NAD-dependent epimerase/dehydratase family protein n=1 Tax=Streptomyces sp. AK02-04a TaxID=3028649 RepID=UPI0029AFCB44|nr:NAD-dependent epimerase/dehydratase family protein [Streptomyces sp. AK02-04a]MDX3763119.1 NAD-dependent epimerase/dehydratase family protein [Streptomyces sp. AK02-04a]